MFHAFRICDQRNINEWLECAEDDICYRILTGDETVNKVQNVMPEDDEAEKESANIT